MALRSPVSAFHSLALGSEDLRMLQLIIILIQSWRMTIDGRVGDSVDLVQLYTFKVLTIISISSIRTVCKCSSYGYLIYYYR